MNGTERLVAQIGRALVVGGGLRLAEAALVTDPATGAAVAIGGAMLAATLTLPTLGYILTSWLRHGHSGLRPVAAVETDGGQ